MRAIQQTTRTPAFIAERWIVGLEARAAIVLADTTDAAAAALVGRMIRVDGCEYRCIAVHRDPSGTRPAAGPRLRLVVESR